MNRRAVIVVVLLVACISLLSLIAVLNSPQAAEAVRRLFAVLTLARMAALATVITAIVGLISWGLRWVNRKNATEQVVGDEPRSTATDNHDEPHLRFKASGWQVSYTAGKDEVGGPRHVEPWEVAGVTSGVEVSARYSFEAEMFNETNVDTDLRDARVVFYWREGEQAESPTGSMVGGWLFIDHVEVLDLPSRKWVRFQRHGKVDDEHARKLPLCRKVTFRANFPSGRVFERPVVVESPGV